jgi:hypothetical protein
MCFFNPLLALLELADLERLDVSYVSESKVKQALDVTSRL